MKTTTLPRLVTVLGAAALWTFTSPTLAVAAVLDFTELPNEGGITATEGVAPLTVTGKTISLFDQVGGFGALGSPTRHVFNLLEPDGSISDQVIVFECHGCSGPRVMFTSDPAQFDLGTPELSTIEDGTRQFVGSYLDNAGAIIQIFVASDVDAAVPQPASIALLAFGLAGLAGTTWRRRRRK